MGRRFALAIACYLFAGPLAAHPGHGTGDGDSLLHHLADPWHATLWIASAAVVVGLAVLLTRRRRTR